MTNESISVLEDQLRECYGRVVYTHKTQEICADILLEQQSKLKLAQIICSAIITGGIIYAFFDSGIIGNTISAVLSTVLLVLNAYTKDYDLGGIAQRHRQAGADLWIIREKYLSLLTDIRTDDFSLESIRSRRDVLLNELHTIYVKAPSTNSKAYQKAQLALKKSGDMTFSDEEIDAFLPNKLKKVSKRDNHA